MKPTGDASERQRRERSTAITAAHIADLKRREQAKRQAEIAIATSISEPHERSEADAAQLKARLKRPFGN